MKNKIIRILISLALAFGQLLLLEGFGAVPALAYTQTHLIDDQIFDSVNSMSLAQIQAFLNGTDGHISGGSTCLKNYQDIDFNWNGSSWVYGPGNISAAQIIYKAAQQWGLNPQVILTTLQKEESLVSGTSCDSWRYNSAMGYACPDSSSCDPKYAGFSKQVLWGSWQLKFNKERSIGNTAWDGDGGITYVGFMTQGSFKRCDTCTVNSYSGYATIDGQSIYLENGSTASLYTYTPHLNQSFPGIFSAWFGDPTSPCLGTTNVGGAPGGPKIIAYRYSGTNLTYTQQNNTGSACLEAHVWGPGYNTWLAHIATGMRATDPAMGTLVASRSLVDNRESLNYIIYSGTGGRVEVHRFSPSLSKFPGYYDVATNLAGVSATSGTFVAGDFFGRGYDQLAYVLYSNGTGRVEVHVFDPSLTKAVGYYDVATNIAGTTPSIGTFVAGDFFGRGYGQLMYVIYNDNSNRVETHAFNQSLTQGTGTQDIITNLTGFDPSQ